jgi:RNA polymerase sigma-B factor
VDALAMEEICHPFSLDNLVGAPDRDRPLSSEERLGTEDAGLTRVEERLALHQEMDHLEPRLRDILELRYFGELSQQEVARRLGISQMQVSRLERRALTRLRDHMATTGAA